MPSPFVQLLEFQFLLWVPQTTCFFDDLPLWDQKTAKRVVSVGEFESIDQDGSFGSLSIICPVVTLSKKVYIT